MQDATVKNASTLPAPASAPAAKWAAVIADMLVPLPRRKLRARDILHQANADGKKLVRDLDSPFDIAFHDDAEVDLAEGNVFRLEDDCECHHIPEFTGPPKFSFVIDDVWQITINPRQTGTTLRGLFDLPPRVDLLRDLESPNDQLIGDAEEIVFADGPVFRTERRTITILVNKNKVTFDHRRVTGLEIKETAIRQGVNIQTSFVLYQILPDESLGPQIDDDQRLVLKDCEAFRCVAPDDNS
jgi:hypothetical protein